MFFIALANKYLKGVKTVFVSILLAQLFSSCDFFEKDVLVSIEGIKLYESDFEDYVSAFDLPLNDDNIKKEFIDMWIEQTLINIELKNTQPNSYLKNKYKTSQSLASLNMFELENEYINSSLDSSISENEILEYYREHKSNYLKNSYIVKALYIKIPDTIAQLKAIKEAFLLKDDKDHKVIQKYANLYGTNFYWERKKWIYADDLLRDVPLTKENKEKIVLSKGHGIFNDNKYVYLINIFDFKLKNNSAPLDIERDKIKKHILKRRINNLRANAKEKILNDIYEKYNINSY